MAHHRKQLVWVLAVGAAVWAQVAPQASCRACDQRCCTGSAGGHRPATPASDVRPVHGCPLCAAGEEPRAAETDGRPCRCGLQARINQPLAASRNAAPPSGDAPPAPGPNIVPPVTRAVLAVSREYLAALLAVPIRPPRILFGVWRN